MKRDSRNKPDGGVVIVHMRTAVILLLLAPAATWGQPAKSMEFEVASVRKADPGQERIDFGPASLTMQHVRVNAIIRWAYDVQDPQVIGPDWMRDVWFDVFAKTTGAVKLEDLRAMTRALLVERWKLEVHRDHKELQALVLSVSKGGHKLEPATEAGSPPLQSGKLNVTGRGATIGDLCGFISHELRDPVIDQTGLSGRFNYFLDIEPYFTEESRKATPDANGKPPDAHAIIAAAMGKELGLKVESKKITVDVIVIDHVEKSPAEN